MFLRVLLATSLLLAGCRSKQSAVYVDPALATLVPADATFLAGIRMKQLRETPLWQRQAAGQKLPILENFRRKTGIDPAADLWEILLASNGIDSILLARGKFTEHGLEPELQREGWRRFSHRGLTLLGDENFAVTFPNATTALAGPTRILRSVIDGRDDGRNGIPKSLQALVEQIPAAQQVWLAGLAVPFQSASPNLKNFDKGIRSFRGGADFRSGIEAEIVAETTSQDDARRLNETVRALIGFARLGTGPAEKELLKVYDGITVTHAESRVEVKLAASVDAAEALMRKLSKP